MLTSSDLTFDLTLKLRNNFLLIFDDFSNVACRVFLASPGAGFERGVQTTPPPLSTAEHGNPRAPEGRGLTSDLFITCYPDVVFANNKL